VKVVLRSDVDGVGRRGDIVDVASGYARNFLFPGGRAIVASAGVAAQAASMRRGRDLREAKDHEAAEAKAKALGGTTVTVTARAGSTGRLFGSVGPVDVVDALRAQKGVELDRHQVALEEAIKAVGTYDVELRLAADLSTTVTVSVVAAGA
jgi:large subunit ribosomal protein L9